MLLSKCKQTLRWRVNVLTVYRCPHRRAFVLDHGIVGDTPTGELVRGSPLKLIYLLTLVCSMSLARYTSVTLASHVGKA